jgi:c-di-GMP-binding flagellar brake protein YcgR
LSLTHSDDKSGGRERRRHPRIKVVVEVELQLETHATPLRLKTAHMSIGGCYITMLFTLEVGTKVKLALCLNDEKSKLQTSGVVVSRDYKVGNGIRFDGMEAEDTARLRRFLGRVAPLAR